MEDPQEGFDLDWREACALLGYWQLRAGHPRRAQRQTERLPGPARGLPALPDRLA